MLARSCCRCTFRARASLRLRYPSPRSAQHQLPFTRTQQARRYASAAGGGSTASSSSVSAQPSSLTGMLAPFVTELDRLAPSVDLRGDQIQILETPTEFYETLKDRIRNAKSRIFLSTLYIGKSERELIDTLAEALRRTPELHLSILTDCLRGTREAPDASCASLLAPLVTEFGAERVEIRMYHTPNLTGLRKKYIPRRINEGWGLQHMKLYGIDDEIILSGANLSTDYFTNRQDRYHLFSSKQVTDHFWNIHSGVCSFSFLVTPSDEDSGFALTWPVANTTPSPLDDPAAFISRATSVLRPLLAPRLSAATTSSSGTGSGTIGNTRVYLLGQMSQITTAPDPATELPVITAILRRLAEPAYRNTSWTFTAGYFNPAPSLTELLLGTASSGGNVVVTASPEANGFYRSSGVSGLLPDAYTLLAKRFLHAAHHRGRGGDDIVLKEWRRGAVGVDGGWTYHAKGLWVTMPDKDRGEGDGTRRRPVMSIIGSSNYTRRSYSHDLEVGALIVTRDPGLRDRLADEQARLQRWARVVSREDFAANERRVGLKVRIAMWIVSLVGGAL